MLQFIGPVSFSLISACIVILSICLVVKLIVLFSQHTFVFYGIGVSTQIPTPNLEDQGICLCLEPHS